MAAIESVIRILRKRVLRLEMQAGGVSDSTNPGSTDSESWQLDPLDTPDRYAIIRKMQVKIREYLKELTEDDATQLCESMISVVDSAKLDINLKFPHTVFREDRSYVFHYLASWINAPHYATDLNWHEDDEKYGPFYFNKGLRAFAFYFSDITDTWHLSKASFIFDRVVQAMVSKIMDYSPRMNEMRALNIVRSLQKVMSHTIEAYDTHLPGDAFEESTSYVFKELAKKLCVGGVDIDWEAKDEKKGPFVFKNRGQTYSFTLVDGSWNLIGRNPR